MVHAHVFRPAVALTLFSFFFGSGNTIFPIRLGIETSGVSLAALFGLLLGGCVLPWLGIVSLGSAQGCLLSYFRPLPRPVALLALVTIFATVGPLGAIPRCIISAYESWHKMGLHGSLRLFSYGISLVSLGLLLSRGVLVTLLGHILSPVLQGCLLTIIIMGFVVAPPGPLRMSEEQPAIWQGFYEGLVAGYSTLDLIGALFFGATIWQLLGAGETTERGDAQENVRAQEWGAVVHGGAAFGMLALCYLGLTLVAARHAPMLSSVAEESLLASLAVWLLGEHGGFIANFINILACLSTVVGLVLASAMMVRQSLPLSLRWGLGVEGIVLMVSALVAPLGFATLMAFLLPLVQMTYPILIIYAVMKLVARWREAG